MISLYVNALLCTLQRIVIHAMQLSGVNETYAHFGLRDGRPVSRAPLCSNFRRFLSALSSFEHDMESVNWVYPLENIICKN